jgi:type IV pilus assembly protein PilQ
VAHVAGGARGAGTTLCAPLAAWAQNAIQSITSTQQAGTEVVRIELAEAAGGGAGRLLGAGAAARRNRPAGRGNALGRNTVEINQGNLRSVSVAQAGERTRLVLNLKQAASYKRELQGKALVVTLEQSGPAVAAGRRLRPGPGHLCAAQNVEVQGLRDIDFRRGNDGAGRVIVNLPSTRWVWTSASRGRTWWSSSCARRCPTACAAGSTSPISAPRCRACPPSRG